MLTSVAAAAAIAQGRRTHTFAPFRVDVSVALYGARPHGASIYFLQQPLQQPQQDARRLYKEHALA